VGFLRRLIKKAQTDEFGFYSFAEEIALNAPQKKMRGEDARRMFLNKGVKQTELEDLGLDELFNQDRVTQDEILQTIDENRIEFEALEYKDSAPANRSFTRETLSFEEAHMTPTVTLEDGTVLRYYPYAQSRDGRFGEFRPEGPPREGVPTGVLDTVGDTTNFQFIEEIYDGLPVFEEGSTTEIGRVKKRFDEESAGITEILEDEDLAREALDFAYNRDEDTVSYIMDDNNDSINDFLFEGAGFEVLDKTDRKILRDAVYFVQRDSYLDDPIEKITITLDGNPTPYSLVGNEDMGYSLPGTSDPRLLNDPSTNPVAFSANEAEVSLSGLLEQYENITDGAQGNLRWADRTLPGGDNAVETVFQLKLPELRFSEDIHYPAATNQVFHVRTKDRVDDKGNLILYVEEFQSDWGQRARKYGLKDPETIEYAEAKAKEELDQLLDFLPFLERAYEKNPRQPRFVDQIRRSLVEPYNISGRRDGTVEVAPEGSAKFGIRTKSIDRLKSALGDYKDDVDEAVRQARRDIITGSFSLEEKQAALKNIYLEAYQQGQRAQNFYLPEALKYELYRGPEELGVYPTSAAKIISDYVDQEDLISLDQKLGEFGAALATPTGFNVQAAADFNRESFKRLLARFKAESYGEVNRRLRELAERDIAQNTLVPMGLTPDIMQRLDKAVKNFEVDEKAKTGAKMASPYSSFIERAPFITDSEGWNTLGVKYIFSRAAREGYDGVAFAPGELHAKRWNKPGLIDAYNKTIPFAISKAFIPVESTLKKPKDKTITVSGEPGSDEAGDYTSRVYLLNEKTKDGKTIDDKAKSRRSMYTIPPAGILALSLTPSEKAEAEEQGRKAQELERTFPDPQVQESAGILGALRGAGEVAYEGLSDLLIEPFVGMSGAELAFELGATPEEAEAAKERARRLVDFETTSPTGLRYKEAVKSGLGNLGEYLMSEGEPRMLRTGVMSDPIRSPAQVLFQEVLDPAAEAVTEGALGILSLDPRDTEEMQKVRQEAARPVIEAIQPI
jgi:hypothetical protein